MRTAKPAPSREPFGAKLGAALNEERAAPAARRRAIVRSDGRPAGLRKVEPAATSP